MTQTDTDFIPEPPGQSSAEFFAGLALLSMSRDQFCELSGVRRDTVANWWKGKSHPSQAAMVILRLMVAGKIDRRKALEINGPEGLDLWEIALDRLGPDRLAAQLPPDLRSEARARSAE